MAKSVHDYYLEFLERFEDYSDLDIIKSFNREVGCGGWGVARSGYLSALRHEFNSRNIDISTISSGKGISYRRRVSFYVLDGKKMVMPIE